MKLFEGAHVRLRNGVEIKGLVKTGCGYGICKGSVAIWERNGDVSYPCLDTGLEIEEVLNVPKILKLNEVEPKVGMKVRWCRDASDPRVWTIRAVNERMMCIETEDSDMAIETASCYKNWEVVEDAV